ncbi:unnamed protein product [Rotaria magnacalcarata]|uniref:TFIIS N-terminal domain-containing protein n=1 Tax=Rotaria magnacalcarata TaxID=392030 RepID=A0A8S2J809_9BILA|nr:unnamed protein product [Rotaria magnacalcarata]
MTEEEIVKINRKLQKMIDKSDVDENIARDLLVRLQESRITLVILQTTGIGKTVNNLRRLIANEDLSIVAKSLLKNWKKLVSETSPRPINKDEKPSTSNNTNNSQSSQETNVNNGKNIASNKSTKQKSPEKPSSSKDVSQSSSLK